MPLKEPSGVDTNNNTTAVYNNATTTNDIKRIGLVGSLQDTVRAVIKRLKRRTGGGLTYKHMRGVSLILAYVWFALGLLPNGCTPQLLHGHF